MKRRSQPPAKRVPFPNRVHWAQPKSLDQISLPAELTNEAIPPDNPQTPEKIALGQKLFFDGRLSADGTVACSTCHDPARAFYRWQAHIDRDQRPRRRTQRTDHSERALHKTQFWDGRVTTLEPPVPIPLLSLLVGGREYSS